MTTFAIIIACIAFMLIVASVRGNPGRAIADTALLVILVGIITIVDLVLSRFMETGEAGQWIALAFACGFADQAHFTRHFKNAFGMPPGRWLNLVSH